MTDYKFPEIMHNWKRMCNTMFQLHGESCCNKGKCPLGEGYGCAAVYELDDKDDVDWDKRAELIMKWAQENPELTYPTWGEWLVQQGVLYTPKLAYHVMGKVNTPIPKEIAEPLGIKPTAPSGVYSEPPSESISSTKF